MSKSVEAFRTIAEVADDLAVPKHVLRFWEVKFPQIRPMKRGGGRRYYRPEDLELLRGIQALLHAEAYTIKGVQKILREQGVDHVKQFGREPISIPGSKAAGKRKRGADAGATTGATHAGATNSGAGVMASGGSHAPQLSERVAVATSANAERGQSVTAAGTQPGRTGAPRPAAGSTRQRLQAILAELEACRAHLNGERPLNANATTAAPGRARAGR